MQPPVNNSHETRARFFQRDVSKGGIGVHEKHSYMRQLLIPAFQELRLEFLLNVTRLRLRNHMEKLGQVSQNEDQQCILRGIRLVVYNPQKTKGSVGTSNRRKN